MSTSTSIMPPSSSSLHSYMSHFKGAAVVSSKSERQKKIILGQPKVLGQEDSESAIAAKEALARQMLANGMGPQAESSRQNEPEVDNLTTIVENKKPIVQRKKSQVGNTSKNRDQETTTAVIQKVINEPIRPKISVNFELSIGTITNLVNEVRVDGNTLSVWGQSGPSDRFRPAADTELVVSFHGGRYNCWSPGIYIDNPNYECSVSVFIIKDGEE